MFAAFALSLSIPASGQELDRDAFVPVFTVDFPDPFIFEHEGRFLAYATNSGGSNNVQMAESQNLVDWRRIADHDAMPTLPPWAREGFTWAPEVLRTDGGYVLYFSARHRERGLQCVGAATAADPMGPFASQATEPLVCQYELGGTIDGSPFRDADGQLYFYYKNDGNNPRFRKPTDIFVQRLSPDGLTLIGEPVALLRNDTDWEAHVIEAPTMVRRSDGYTLFFSANHFGWEADQRLSRYAMGYATCQGPLGPCIDAPGNPILYSYNNREAGCLSGPGHQMIFDARGRSFIAFHAWAATPGCRKTDPRRYMYIAPLGWRGPEPRIGVSLRPSERD
ncbi:MAG TPA: glycoside hydrolase family 43 protein [Allosphingosinicella sp.]|nr:glycoside hydrolase family 43 protein [Allosphingosinicella sp.]